MSEQQGITGLTPSNDVTEGASVVGTGAIEPPVYVSGGKRLSFSRRDLWTDEIGEEFCGFGKDESCIPSCSWEELCALADLVVKHPAFRLPETVNKYHPPLIEDAE